MFIPKKMTVLLVTSLLFMITSRSIQAELTYPIVTTGQKLFYDNSREMSAPSEGEDFYGQDASYKSGAPFSFTDNGDGTVSDNSTGLMWQKSPDFNKDGVIDANDKMTLDEATAYASEFNLAGYNDWRLPTIKELYSLIQFSGMDISGPDPRTFVPFIDTSYFSFGYGDESAGERLIDAQYATSTNYVSTTMNRSKTMFGVNFADGRIKGYPYDMVNGSQKSFYVMYVRGSNTYGINKFHDNGDGTITDSATGLMWMKEDNGEAVSWKDALSYAEQYSGSGYSDWRLPNAKELQSIVDYTRSPATTNSAAIDSLFECTQITDEGGNANYPFYWTSTTHANISMNSGNHAAYVCFGEALGWMEMPPMSGNFTLMDVHGAGAQRSDLKTGDPTDYPNGFGPQGDVVRINNYVRLVRTFNAVDVKKKSVMNTNTKKNLTIAINKNSHTLSLANTSDGITSISIFSANGRKLYYVSSYKKAGMYNYLIPSTVFLHGLCIVNAKCGKNQINKIVTGLSGR